MAKLTDIDPTTGTFWKADQPEYWVVAANAYRAITVNRDYNLGQAMQCEAKALKLGEARRG